MKATHAVVATVALLGSAGCAKTRLVAATQPTPAAFDPAGSDPAALQTVTEALAALGGADAWGSVKELRFAVKYTVDGTTKSWFRHSWDRWNGRHFYAVADLTGGAVKPDDVKWTEVGYDLFDAEKLPHASYDGKEISRDDAKRISGNARERLREEGYLLTAVYKLRDPGVHLRDAGEVKDLGGACLPSCRSVKVTFDPGVGSDTWYVNFNTQTKLPEAIETERKGGRLGYKLTDWVAVGPLKLPSKASNIGLVGEVYLFEAMAVGEPDDATYERQLR